MAESPETWDLLTASLAVCDLRDAQRAWSFLVHHDLVRDEEGDRERFIAIVQYEIPREITGPTLSRRVALSLGSAGLTLPAGDTPDPMARIAAERMKRYS